MPALSLSHTHCALADLKPHRAGSTCKSVFLSLHLSLSLSVFLVFKVEIVCLASAVAAVAKFAIVRTGVEIFAQKLKAKVTPKIV